ncbi:MAG: VanZ family protein [Nitrospira sp.]|nr:VanZ family protein [Nitrospira sp.]
MGVNAFRILTLPVALKPRTELLWLWLAVLVLTPLFPLENFVGHAHWDSVRWVPFQDFSFSANGLIDIAGNTVWFMVLGYLSYYWTKEPVSPFKSIAMVLLLASGVSLSLELFQVYCHNRTPSMTDVACNLIGAALGGYFGWKHRAQLAAEPVRYLVIEENGSQTIL